MRWFKHMTASADAQQEQAALAAANTQLEQSAQAEPFPGGTLYAATNMGTITDTGGERQETKLSQKRHRQYLTIDR